MKLEVNQSVVTVDEQSAGEIERLIVDPGDYEVVGVVIQAGTLLKEDKIVDLSQIAGVDRDIVRLTISESELEQLPPFVREEYFVPSPERFHSISSQGWAGSAESGDIVGEIRRGTPDRHLVHRSSFGEENVVLAEGTDVIGSDGEKVGTVDEIVTTEEGFVRAFIVQAGFIFHHDVIVPIDWIERIGSDQVELKVTKERLEQERG